MPANLIPSRGSGILAWRRWLLPSGAAVASVVGLHFGVDLSWTATVEASATVTLVALTGQYVVLTDRLVKVQMAIPRIEGQERSLRDLYTFLAQSRSTILTWSLTAQLNISGQAAEYPAHAWQYATNPDSLVEEMNQVAQTLTELSALLAGTLPSATLIFASLIQRASYDLTALASSIRASVEGLTPDQVHTWEVGSVEKYYLTGKRAEEVAWSDIEKGTGTLRAVDAFPELFNAVMAELKSDEERV